MLVRAEPELAPYGLEVRSPESGAQCAQIVHFAPGRRKGAADEARRIIALARVQGGVAAVGIVKIRNEALVGRVLQIACPL